MSKRFRFIISSLTLSLGFILIQFLDEQYRFLAILLLAVLTGAFSFWSYFEGIGKDMTLLSLILPTLFTLGVGIFWFLLPVSVYTRIPIVIFYSVGIYVLSSTMNIYTVSSIRTIALLRAARGVGFVLTLITSFFLFDAILSIRQNLFITLPLIFTSSFLLLIQGLWSIDLDREYDKQVFVMSLISGLIVAELASLIFFWPVTIVVGSLFLTSGVYLLLGLGQSKLEGRLFPSVVNEYLFVGLIVLGAMFFATRWG